MLGVEAIVAINRDIARRAAARRRMPYVPYNAAEVEQWPPFPFPNLGYHVPDGWEPTGDRWFVDKTGWGLDWEPALTAEQFIRQLQDFIDDNPGVGFAISEPPSCIRVPPGFRIWVDFVGNGDGFVVHAT